MALFFVVPLLLATLRTGGDTRVAVVDLTGGRLYDPLSAALSRADAQQLLRRLLDAGARVSRFEQVEPSLHDIFIEQVGEGA
jgi:hypothetical protein